MYIDGKCTCDWYGFVEDNKRNEDYSAYLKRDLEIGQES